MRERDRETGRETERERERQRERDRERETERDRETERERQRERERDRRQQEDRERIGKRTIKDEDGAGQIQKGWSQTCGPEDSFPIFQRRRRLLRDLRINEITNTTTEPFVALSM